MKRIINLPGLFILVMALGLSSCENKEKFAQRINVAIYEYQRNGDSDEFGYFRLPAETREASEWEKSICFSTGQDTIYFLGGMNIEFPAYYLTVWNKNDTISFENTFKGFKKNDSPQLITAKTMQLVGDWNKKEIERLESVVEISDGLYFDATRVIIKNNTFEIESFYFDSID